MAKEPNLRDAVVLLLTNGMTVDAAESFCQSKGLDLDSARRTVAEARQRITIAAEFARDEQLGKAVIRLNDLYAKAIAAQEPRTALQAQRELNRLLGLYSLDKEPDPGSGDGGESSRQLELVASYLIPLGLTDERYPVEEHARIAAQVIRENGFAEQPELPAPSTAGA
jgi:hypothetical protein